MSLPAPAAPFPLRMHEDGVVRVGGTRATLGTVVAAFREGLTAEGIWQQYPSLELADVYATISYYLQEREWVESYLRERETNAAEVRREVEARSLIPNYRERLLARRK